MKYEVVHQQPNGECSSVFFNEPEKALDHANEILKTVKREAAFGYVSVSEVQIVDGEIVESAILLAQVYGGGF